MERLSLLAGGIAREFNNLLQVILGYSQQSSAPVTNPESAAMAFDRIDTAANRAAALTRQLLAFSSKQTVNPEQVDLVAVVSSLTPKLGKTLRPG